MDPINFLKDQIRAAIPNEFKNISEVAEKAGVNQPNLSELMKGNRKSMKLETAWKLIDALGLEVRPKSPGGDYPTIRRIGSHAPEVEVKGDNLVTVPVMAVAGAGPGQFAFSLEPIDHIPILRDFIHPLLFVCKIEGDSMEPTIMSGAYVGAIPPERLHEGKMYVFYDEVLGAMVKRLYYDGPGKLALVSDNKATPPVKLDARGYENVIVGEVLWVWQKFK